MLVFLYDFVKYSVKLYEFYASGDILVKLRLLLPCEFLSPILGLRPLERTERPKLPIIV